MRVASTAAPAWPIAATMTAAGGPTSRSTTTPTRPPRSPPTVDIRDICALAATSRPGSSTSRGTRALFAIEYVLPSTRTANASGKKNSVVR